jgi:hypothetical protein
LILRKLSDDVIGKLVAYAREWFETNDEVSGNSVGQLCSKHLSQDTGKMINRKCN